MWAQSFRDCSHRGTPEPDPNAHLKPKRVQVGHWLVPPELVPEYREKLKKMEVAMRWSVAKGPSDGEVRNFTRFAFLPTPIGDTWVWLERYVVVKQYLVSAHDGGGWWRVLDMHLQGEVPYYVQSYTRN